MGNSYSCYNCFSHEFKQFGTEKYASGLYESSTCNMIENNHNYQQNFEEPEVIESEALSKTELIDTITKTMGGFLETVRKDPTLAGYKQVLVQNSVEVLLKDVTSGYSLMSIWKCTFPAEKVAKFLRMVEKRKE